MSRDTDRQDLMAAWCGEPLDEARLAALLDHLRSDAAFRREAAEQIRMLGGLKAVQASEPRWLRLRDELGLDEPETASENDARFEAEVQQKIRSLPILGSGRMISWGQCAALAAVLLLLGLVVKVGWFGQSENLATNSAETKPSKCAYLLSVDGPDTEGLDDLVPGAQFGPRVIEMQSGTISLQTTKGVSLTIEAPLLVRVISADAIELTEGRLRARVPDGAQGFRVHAPGFKVIDLGTEFSVEVDENHDGRVRVFEGRADVALVDDFGTPLVTKQLVKDQAVKVTRLDQEITRLTDDNPSHYISLSLPILPGLQLIPEYSELVQSMNPECYWRFEELRDRRVPNEVKEGPALVAFGSADIKPVAPNNSAANLGRPATFEGFRPERLWDNPLDGDFTLTFWVQFSWLQHFSLVAAQRYDEEVKGQSLLLQAYPHFAQSGFEGTGLRVTFRDPPAWMGGQRIYSSKGFRPRWWHHVGVAREGGWMRLYVDGRLLGEGVVPTARPDFKGFVVGRMNMNPDQDHVQAGSLAGRLDELAVFHRALQADEIEALAEGGHNIEPKQLVQLAE